MRDHFVVLVTTARCLQAPTLELATRLAGQANAVLMFLHVTPLRPSDGEAMLFAAVDASEEEAWARARVPSDTAVRYRHRVVVGDPEEVIEAFVAAQDVECVVVEEPPRSRLSTALWRGLAERLVGRLACPVVIGGPRFLARSPRAVGSMRSAGAGGRVADVLNGVIEARVESVRCWMDHAADATRRAADALTLRTVAARASTGPVDRQMEDRLVVEMAQRMQALHAVSWRLTIGEHVWGPFGMGAVTGPSLEAFMARVRANGQSTSLPVVDDANEDRLLVLSAALVSGGRGVLVIAFDAEADFLRILGQPGPVPSFETYAFDDRGVMLSNSCFPDQLLRAGLMPDGHQTPLRLRVAEPGEGPADAWPLTLCARQAIGRGDGFDTRGYRDYRGTSVVGAWRWLSDYGFGVVAEVDRLAG